MVLVFSISNFFIDKISHANKWMEKKLSCSSNSALEWIWMKSQVQRQRLSQHEIRTYKGSESVQNHHDLKFLFIPDILNFFCLVKKEPNVSIFMVILNLCGVSFYAVVIFGLLFKSIPASFERLSYFLWRKRITKRIYIF